MRLGKFAPSALLGSLILCACSANRQQAEPKDADSGLDATGAGGSAGSSGSGKKTWESVGCDFPMPAATGLDEPEGAPDGVEVLDWAGFTGAISYTFDDSNSSQLQHYAELNALGVPMTFYLQTGKSESANDVWTQALADGHELGNHTKSHGQTGTAEDVDAATAFIEDHFGVTPYTMAAPYGDTSYISLAEPRFLINRGVGGGSIAPKGNANRFNLPCYTPAEGADASAFNGTIDRARTAGNWQVVLVHGFTGGSDGAYQPVDLEQFTSSVEYAKGLGDLWIDSVVHVGAYWIAQKLFSSVTPISNAAGTIWSWTLPDHFPKGVCLRVRTAGGTLMQQDETLTWSNHGYYEVALDAGSLTLAP